ncbi:MAG TPA: hypothetical protein VFW22_09990 [Pseudolabrys sp.]|nr:hypothetical protein [Pseudolabrys sp.]
MLELIWRVVYREWQKIRVAYDPSFEAAVLFSLLGLVVTTLYLTRDLFTVAPVNTAALFHVLQ